MSAERRLSWLRGAFSRPQPAPRLGMAVTGFRVRADFEGGNVDEVALLSPSHLRFCARADDSPRPLWFFFCIEDARTPAVRCDLMNADRCVGPREGWRTARPVFSADGRIWHRTAHAGYVEEREGGYFTFTVPVVGERTYVAYCYPYTTADLQRFLEEIRGRPGVEIAELCRSGEGRGIPVLRLGNHRDPRAAVWVVARQHAGETPASFAVEGLIRALADLPPDAGWIAETAVHIAPMVDVDGVYHGRYGKDRQPVDFNRDWQDEPRLPEIAGLVRAIRQTQADAPVRLALDLHAPHHGDAACYLFGYGPDDGAELLAAQERLAQAIAAASPPAVGFDPSDVRTNHRPPGSARDFLHRSLGIPVWTVEISYHLSRSGRYLTPSDYRDFGAALAAGITGYFGSDESASPEG